eukprot:72300_1
MLQEDTKTQTIDQPQGRTNNEDNMTELSEIQDEMKEITIYVWIDRLNNVDVVKQTFDAEFDLILAWAGTKEDIIKYKTNKNDYKPVWLPDYKIKNGDCEQTLIEYRVISESNRTDYYGLRLDINKLNCAVQIRAAYRVKGSFYETYELERFPLDCQDLQFNFELKDPISICVFCPDPPERAGEDQWMDSAGWMTQTSNISGYQTIEKAFFEFYCIDYSIDCGETDNAYSIANLKLKLKRKWGVYFWRVGMVMMITSLCSILAFALDGGLTDQLGLLFTLLLTVVAFQFVAASYVPNLEYLTFLDWYVCVSFLFIFVVIITVTVVHLFDLEHIEGYCGIAEFLIFLMIQLAFGIKGYKARKYELRKMGMDRFDYYNEGYMASDDVQAVACMADEDDDGVFGVRISERMRKKLSKPCWDFLPKGKKRNDGVSE